MIMAILGTFGALLVHSLVILWDEHSRFERQMRETYPDLYAARDRSRKKNKC